MAEKLTIGLLVCICLHVVTRIGGMGIYSVAQDGESHMAHESFEAKTSV